MKEIKHSFHFASPVAKIKKALLEEAHLKKWWTVDASVANGKGVFPFKGYGWTVELDMNSKGDNLITWKCTKSNMQNTKAWEGSTITFKLTADGSGTVVQFLQSDYQDSKCLEACTEGWEEFIGTSLRSYVETGEGHPYKSKN